MKNLMLLLVLALWGSLSALAQDKWPALDDYHMTMAETFHPAEEGDLKPVMMRSGELADKAAALKKSEIPAAFQKEGVKKSVGLLAKESKALDKMVRAQQPEAEIKAAIFALHDRFHELVGKCHH